MTASVIALAWWAATIRAMAAWEAAPPWLK